AAPSALAALSRTPRSRLRVARVGSRSRVGGPQVGPVSAPPCWIGVAYRPLSSTVAVIRPPLALDLAADRPFGLGRVDEADPDVLALGLSDFDQEVGQLLRYLVLLVGRAALVPLDGYDGHGAAGVPRRRLPARAPRPGASSGARR